MSDLILFKSENFQGIECDFWKNSNDEIFMTSEQLGSVLGYSNPRKSINNIVTRNAYLREVEFSSGITMMSEAGNRETRVFTEDGIYEVAFLAETVKAKEFRFWVRQILKGLRKSELELLRKQLEEVKPKLLLYDQVINAENYMSMLMVSKALKLSGRNKLFRFLRSEGILMSGKDKRNLPYQPFIDNGYFVVVVKSKIIEGKIIDFPVTLVTSKGMDYILKRLEKEQKERLGTEPSQLIKSKG